MARPSDAASERSTGAAKAGGSAPARSGGVDPGRVADHRSIDIANPNTQSKRSLGYTTRNASGVGPKGFKGLANNAVAQGIAARQRAAYSAPAKSITSNFPTTGKQGRVGTATSTGYSPDINPARYGR